MLPPESTSDKTHLLAEDSHPSQPGSPVAEGRCRLVVLSGPTKGCVVSLRNITGTEVQIGKAENNDLPVPHPTVSRQHCVLIRDEAGWILRDLRSTNGTFVDDTKIRETYVRPGAIIKVGNISIQFTTEMTPIASPPSARQEFGRVLGKSIRMREIFGLLERVADRDAAVLITGETGTGKGSVARSIHEQSKRADSPFVVVDCASVAPTLIESELFGHERGAFTGADQRRVGALEYVQCGTLFLDELDELRKDLQPRLLRVLEDRIFQRVGANQPQRFTARVIAATKRDAHALVAQGALREDLYFRLAVFRIELPPSSRAERRPSFVG